MEAIPAKTYSNTDVATAIKKSGTQVKAYKKLVLRAFQKDLERVQAPNKSLTEEGFSQIKMAARFVSKSDSEGYLKAVFQANPALEFSLDGDRAAESSTPFDTTLLRGGAMVPVVETDRVKSNSLVFDSEAAAAELALIREKGYQFAGNLGGAFAEYAQARAKQAFHEIDATVEAVKINALANVGLESQGGEASPNA